MGANTRASEAGVLITGAGGVLGLGLAATRPSELVIALAGRHRPAAWPATPFLEFDLEEAGAAAACIQALRPAAVLHAAACSRLDSCEDDPQRAERVNHQAVVEIVAACSERGAFLVLVSTDQVFGGDGGPYAEDAAPRPLHAYGRSKAAAEHAVLAAGGAVARLPLLLGPAAGPERRGADTALLEQLAAGLRPTLYEDEIRCPAGVDAVADGLWRLLERRRSGVFHLVGAEAVSRAELGRRICAAAGVAPDFDRGPSPGSAANPPRPLRLELGGSRARSLLGWEPPDLRQSLARFRAATSE